MTGVLTFGQWLKQRRRETGLAQKDLAQRVECSPVTIVKIETGERRPSGQIALLLAQALGVPLDEQQAFVEFARTDLSGAQFARLVATNPQAPWRALHGAAVHLPTPPTSFVGREGVVADIQALLRRPGVRLLTLTGPPGIGKTRLALQVAEISSGDFPDGVYFVALGTIRDPDPGEGTGQALMVSSIAQALEVPEVRGRSLLDALKSHLRDKRVLLVLDNFEQIVQSAPVVSELLISATWLKVLVTSREALHLYGEHTFPVPPMSAPGTPGALDAPRATVDDLTDYEAVRLFVERAFAVKSDFALTPANAPAVVQICLELDRLPLAIELAAARARMFTPGEILSRLENRLELLTGGSRDLPERQRALRNAIDWSYDLLDRDEQVAFRRLAVFSGGCTLEAARAIIAGTEAPVAGSQVGEHSPPGVAAAEAEIEVVVADVGTCIESLLNKSLIQQEYGNAQTRYSMLETIRDYALEKLEQNGESTAIRGRHAQYFLSMAQSAGAGLLSVEQAAWLQRLDIEHDNLRAALGWLLSEGHAEIALKLSDALWRFWQLHGHLSEGRRWLELALQQPGAVAPVVRANALTDAGNLAWSAGDFQRAGAHYEESLRISLQLGDKRAMARPLNNLAVLAYSWGDFDRSAALFRESLAIKQELGDKAGIASSLHGLGNVEADRGNYEIAERLLRDSLALFRELGNREGTGSALNNLGITISALGKLDDAEILYKQALEIRRETGDKQGVAGSLINLGVIAYCRGDYASATSLFEQGLSIRRGLDDRRGIAVALRHVGYGMLAQRRPRRAAMFLQQSLDIYLELGDPSSITECLVGFAGVALLQKQYVRAATLLGAIDAQLRRMGFHLYPVERMVNDRGLDEVHSALDDASWVSAWEEGIAMSLDGAVSYTSRE